MTSDTPPYRQTIMPYKSQAEWNIANLLDQYSVPFVYEKPTAVVDSGKTKIWYPDFTLAYGPLIEYFGINGSQGYRNRTTHKLKVYEQNQIEVIPMYPRDMEGHWRERLLKRIDNRLEYRLNDYRGKIEEAGFVGQPYSHSQRY